MTPPDWTPEARRDLTILIDHIADENPDAAERLLNDIMAKIAELPRYPRMYPVGRVNGTREMLVRKHFKVVYVEDGEAVTFVAVLLTAQQWPK